MQKDNLNWEMDAGMLMLRGGGGSTEQTDTYSTHDPHPSTTHHPSIYLGQGQHLDGLAASKGHTGLDTSLEALPHYFSLSMFFSVLSFALKHSGRSLYHQQRQRHLRTLVKGSDTLQLAGRPSRDPLPPPLPQPMLMMETWWCLQGRPALGATWTAQRTAVMDSRPGLW